MISFRRQLPVASPLSAAALLRAALSAAARSDRRGEVEERIAEEFGATAVLLTDSGTSALVLALRIAAGKGETVALPAYACANVVAAARRAEVRVRLFDVDPHTLTPDIDSLRRVIEAGVSAVVVAHLYGFPSDMPAVMKAAHDAGVPVIEDAAQHAGATIGGRAAGSFGDLTVLSFGRGKGTTSGRGGALLVSAESMITDAQQAPDLAPASSMTDLAIAAASWMLGRPSIYGIPASIPALHLGETVYHEAGEPRSMSMGAAALLERTLAEMHEAVIVRRTNAQVLRSAADQSRRAESVRAIDSGLSGYLRYPVLLRGEPRDAPALGIAHGYPNPLSLEPQIMPCLVASAEPLHGAIELARRLVTLPTHHMVTQSDLAAISRWVREG